MSTYFENTLTVKRPFFYDRPKGVVEPHFGDVLHPFREVEMSLIVQGASEAEGDQSLEGIKSLLVFLLRCFAIFPGLIA